MNGELGTSRTTCFLCVFIGTVLLLILFQPLNHAVMRGEWAIKVLSQVTCFNAIYAYTTFTAIVFARKHTQIIRFVRFA